MPTPYSHEPDPWNNDPSNALQRRLDLKLEQIRAGLDPDLAAELLPQGCTLTSIQTEVYRSPELQTARAAMPGSYDDFDRSLVILGLQDRQQVFIIVGKINPADPTDIEQSIGGGVDQRRMRPTVYTYDGVSTITKYAEEGISLYTGAEGDPNLLLSNIRPRLGLCIATETLGIVD